ncbi:MAG: ATP-binding cassette domain-containing protein [Bacteroidales bacterium]|nr:ATP-binding cassette domain-containing protein [Bacteroidales bacterium]
MDFLKIDQVEKRFVDNVALDHVSMDVPENTIYGLLGPNGAGKTTLIRIINRITAPDKGEVYLKGKKIRMKDVFRIGYLPEERGLYKKMKVGEQALYLAQLKGMDRRSAIGKLKYWFEKFKIQDWWEKKVEELSKGMQQKVQFINTVVHEPDLLIFDEPFSGFDPINANLLKNEVLRLKEKGATIIFSTHNMGSVEELCDNITLIDRAQNLLEGPIDDIRHRYKSNIFEVAFNGDAQKLQSALNNNYQVMEWKKQNGNQAVQIKLLGENSDNNLLSLIIPAVEVISFREVIPSMNDIFIKVVNEVSN